MYEKSPYVQDQRNEIGTLICGYFQGDEFMLMGGILSK